MVLDVGGATADITVKTFVRGAEGVMRLEDLVLGTGDVCGGGQIDDCFFEYFEQCVAPGWTELARANPALMHDIRNKFQLIKRGLNTEPEASVTALTVTNVAVLKLVDEKKYPEKEDCEIVLAHNAIKKIFDDAVSHIVYMVRERLELVDAIPENRSRRVQLFLVGGVSQSHYVRTCLERQFPTDRFDVRVTMSPAGPGGAIYRGAALFGLYPEIFGARMMRRCYGCASAQLVSKSILPVPEAYQEVKRNPAKPSQTRLGYMQFDAFVRKGQRIQLGQEVEHTFLATPGRTLRIELLTCDNADVMFALDPAVVKVGAMRYNVPAALQDPTIVVAMSFGGTHIRASVYPRGQRDHVVEMELSME